MMKPECAICALCDVQPGLGTVGECSIVKARQRKAGEWDPAEFFRKWGSTCDQDAYEPLAGTAVGTRLAELRDRGYTPGEEPSDDG